MEINVINLPVRTVGGQALGRVIGVRVEPATQGVVAYNVATHRLLAAMSPTLIISRQRVVELTTKEMVVEDAVVPSSAPAPAA